MGAYFHEYNVRAFLLKYGAIVPGYVDASATGKSFFDGMIIEKWMIRISAEKINSFRKSAPNRLGQHPKPLSENTVVTNQH